MHFTNVSVDGLGEGFRMHVHLENVEDLRKQLLLMQVVKLKSGIHSVDNGMFVDKSWELFQNVEDQGSGVAEVVHNVTARSDLVSLVHAIVESSNTIDVVDLVDSNPSDMGDRLLENLFSGSLDIIVALIFFSLDKSE